MSRGPFYDTIFPLFLVKNAWTPSFALVAGGYSFAMLALFLV